MTTGNSEPAALLKAWRDGDEAARDRLIDLLHGEFVTIASLLLKRERLSISLFTGDLVNEAMVRILQSDDIDVVDKNHLLALAARVMRHVLLDAARGKNRHKRKGVKVTLTESNKAPDGGGHDLLALERALVRLHAIDPTRAAIVEMRFFGGLTIDEIATVLGVRQRHLDRPVSYRGPTENQLDYLHAAGVLAAVPDAADAIANVDWRDPAQPLALRARAYLDINCAHCHNPVGPADTSGLDLTATAEHGLTTGLCKLPIAAGSGTGGRAFSIVPGAPDASILVHRMETTDPAAMMPELGRTLAHDEGVDLIRRWVAAMEGAC